MRINLILKEDKNENVVKHLEKFEEGQPRAGEVKRILESYATGDFYTKEEVDRMFLALYRFNNTEKKKQAISEIQNKLMEMENW